MNSEQGKCLENCWKTGNHKKEEKGDNGKRKNGQKHKDDRGDKRDRKDRRKSYGKFRR